MTSKLIITPDIKVAELLKEYPQLEDKLIEIAPVFVKLKNPILRKTIAKVTTLKQASVVGKVSIGDLINKLRAEVGQGNTELSAEKSEEGAKPDWIDETNIRKFYDAREDLEAGVHPVNKVVQETNTLKAGEIYLLVTSFTPAPLIDMVSAKGFQVYSADMMDGRVLTYFRKQ